MTADSFEEISADLDRIADRLADLAMDLLREGLSAGTDEAALQATKREKIVNRARSSVVKALSLVERAASEGTGEGGGDSDEEDGFGS